MTARQPRVGVSTPADSPAKDVQDAVTFPRDVPAPPPRAGTYPLTHLQRRLLGCQDSKARRCWYCGDWSYDQQDCGTCAAPANRGALEHDLDVTA